MNNNFINISTTCIMLVVFLISILSAQSLEWQGQVSSWLTVNPAPKLEGQIGLRYIPSISIQKYINEQYQFDGVIASNMYAVANHYFKLDDEINGDIKPYRLWLRLTSNQLELRAGLQKINFGSATLLRPLMWFDRIDPRDPLQLTDGVYGLLGRYYFLNNTNIWLWVLYGNDETKGWEVFPSADYKPEFGGRLQIPVWTGEIALSGHHRSAYIDNSGQSSNNSQTVKENRLSIDGKWDAGVGIWFEGAMNHANYEEKSLHYTRMLNLGMDYTFDIGNGLHILAEYLRVDVSADLLKLGRPSSLAALTMNYPLGLLDNLNTIFYYDWTNDNFYRFLSWQRTYDHWSFYMMGFWNPNKFQIYQNQQDQNLFAGKGFQVMVVLNH